MRFAKPIAHTPEFYALRTDQYHPQPAAAQRFGPQSLRFNRGDTLTIITPKNSNWKTPVSPTVVTALGYQSTHTFRFQIATQSPPHRLNPPPSFSLFTPHTRVPTLREPSYPPPVLAPENPPEQTFLAATRLAGPEKSHNPTEVENEPN